MKQKVIMEIQMTTDKCKRKAMKIAADANGVITVSIEGSERMIVVGKGVDSVELIRTLRKKLNVQVKLLSVQQNPPLSKDRTGVPYPTTSSYMESNYPNYESNFNYNYGYNNYNYPGMPVYPHPSAPVVMVQDPYGPNTCTIL